MSLEMCTYAAAVDDDLIPRWVGRMNELGMHCEIHPEFSFHDTGFLPFKVTLERSKHDQLVGTPYLTGFEFDMSDFNLEEEIAALTPKAGLMDKLLGRKEPVHYFANPEIDARLAACTKLLSFVYGTADSLQFRMAVVSSAVLAELTGGVCCYPADDDWYPTVGLVERAVKEANEYEESLHPRDLQVQKFEGWL